MRLRGRNPRSSSASKSNSWCRDYAASRGGGKKDLETERLTGRARDNRLVHFRAPEGTQVRPGDQVRTTVTYAAPFHLVADSDVTVTRTRAGDAWEARRGQTSVQAGVSLGMPSMGAPAPTGVVDLPACAPTLTH
jgi:tRNA-2-methylthio-N6-dimethylallyladenosine synthase